VLDDAAIERILVVTAHPDDVDFGAAGTVAGWVDSGIAVTYCICTDGQAGGSDRSVSRTDMAALRRDEQRAAAAAVGVKDVRFLGHMDGELYPTHELRRDISRVIRDVRPQRVLTQSPERWWERPGASHPDHRAAGDATMDAVYPDARNPFAHPSLLQDEGLEPWSVPEVWLMASPRADHVVDVTDALDRKVAALRAHASQTAHMDDLTGMLRQWMGQAATAAGLPEGRVAERFQVVTLPA
jgi:LmbE family N-acetylglucosaminyl deacetylase